MEFFWGGPEDAGAVGDEEACVEEGGDDGVCVGGDDDLGIEGDEGVEFRLSQEGWEGV